MTREEKRIRKDLYGKTRAEIIAQWKEEADQIDDATRQKIMDLKKSGKSVSEVCADLQLEIEHVSIIVIDGFAKERGETAVYTVTPYA